MSLCGAPSPDHEVDSSQEPSHSSGVYICESIANDFRHENYMCKSEVIDLRSIRQCILGVKVGLICDRFGVKVVLSCDRFFGVTSRQLWLNT